MEKRNVIRKNRTLCDECSSTAAIFTSDGIALCRRCSSVKKAEVKQPRLKTFSDELSDKHSL